MLPASRSWLLPAIALTADSLGCTDCWLVGWRAGKRHEHQYDFQVAYEADGTITALITTITSNAGWAYDSAFG